MAKTVYFALAFAVPGCIPHGTPSPYATNTRRGLKEAIEGAFYDDPRGARKALSDLDIRRVWRHAKAHGLSSVFRELDCGREGEVLCLMGMTQAEYQAAEKALDY